MDKYKLQLYMQESPDAKLRDLVMKLLYDEIVSLRISPGSKLNVNQIAASLGISRTPVAEAISSLTEIGFVVSHPGQAGSFVLDLSLRDMINLYRVRDAIESEAAARAQCGRRRGPGAEPSGGGLQGQRHPPGHPRHEGHGHALPPADRGFLRQPLHRAEL